MDEKGIFAAWQGNDDQERELLKAHRGEFLRLAQKQSSDIFKKIRSNIIWEMILTAIICATLPLFFVHHPFFFWLIITLIIISLITGIRIYFTYLRNIEQLDECSILESLGRKREILSRYVRHLNFYLLVFAPMGFVVGFSFALKPDDLNLIKILVLSGVSLPFLALTIWLCRKYIYQLYGKHLKRIEEIHDHLREK